jgi:hypothetical protein
MLFGEFTLALKSSVDREVYKLAAENAYEFFDLDGAYLLPEQAESTKPAIAWSLLNIIEAPRDPFYSVHFEVGARTSNDVAQYDSMRILCLIQNAFPVNKDIRIVDYSKEYVTGEVVGYFLITSTVSTPPSFDKVSSIRTIQFTAAVQRFI